VAEDDLTPEQLFEQIKQIKIPDLLLSTISTLAQLGFAKLEEQSRDLEQARFAIEGIKALLPVVEGGIPDEIHRDLGQMLANLQLSFASAASASVSE
jgi:hypothetical protein